MSDLSGVDDKVQYIVPFICSQLDNYGAKRVVNPLSEPFVVGLNGIQGVGKSFLVSLLKKTLESEPYCLPTVIISLDDFYLTNADQKLLAELHSDNPLIQHRGLPGTHDLPLALRTLKSLKQSKPTKIPVYNKAAFEGQGDRFPESEWEMVNLDPANSIKVVLFEGWSVGFRSLSLQSLLQKYDSAVTALNSQTQTYQGRLAHNTLKSLAMINDTLKMYDTLTDQLDTFIYLKAADLQYVYKWRLQQEACLRAEMGVGMTDEQVHKFIDGYFPAYELYSDELDKGVYSSKGEEEGKKQMTLLIDGNRNIQKQINVG